MDPILLQEKPFERRILCFQSWCMINKSLANCVWQAGEILTCHDGWKVKKILLIQKEGLCSFYGHLSQRLYRTFLLKFVNSLSSLVCRCRPIQFLQARVLRSGELFGTRASCLLLGSWITIANREHFKLRYPSLLRSSKEQKCKYIIHVYKHPII